MRNTGISEEIKAGRESLAMLHAVVASSRPTPRCSLDGTARGA